MVTGSSAQPLAALIFLIGGGLAYFTYEVLRMLRFNNKLPVLTVITDGIYAVAVFLFFILLSHVFFSGRIKYFTILCYIFGIIIVRLTLKPIIRSFLQRVKTVYKKLAAKYTKPKEKRS